MLNSKDKEKGRKLKKYFSHYQRIDIVVAHPYQISLVNVVVRRHIPIAICNPIDPTTH
jgi:hypothetical protein